MFAFTLSEISIRDSASLSSQLRLGVRKRGLQAEALGVPEFLRRCCLKTFSNWGFTVQSRELYLNPFPDLSLGEVDVIFQT